MQVIEREFRHHRPLERVDEADTEDVIAFFSDRSIGRSWRNHRNFRVLANRRGCERARACDFADSRNRFVVSVQFVNCWVWLARSGLVVFHNYLELSSGM